jgi:hypothetical protein
MEKKIKAYSIGSFSGWRDEIISVLPFIEFDDPRNHDQSSITRLDYQDMESAMSCPISIVYLYNDKRAGTMSYCELGASRAKGNIIIAIDENEKKDSLIEKIASHYFTSKERTINFLSKNQNSLSPKYNEIFENNKTKDKTPCKNVLFSGDLEEIQELMENVKKCGKNVYSKPPVQELDNFGDKFDLVVVNFKKDLNYHKYGLYHMGIGYATKVPIIELDGNPFPYPPLLGLARRVFTGDKRFEIAEKYLSELNSQHISDEAMICYKLFKEYNK